MSETDEPLRFFYDDAKTLYELFRKAEKLSSKEAFVIFFDGYKLKSF